MSADNEARQRLDKLAMEVLYAHWDDDHPTGQAIRGIIAALLDDDAVLADVVAAVAAAGRDRILKAAQPKSTHQVTFKVSASGLSLVCDSCAWIEYASWPGHCTPEWAMTTAMEHATAFPVSEGQ